MLRKIAAVGLAFVLAVASASAQIRPDDLPPLSPGDLLFKGAESGTGARIAASWSLGDKRWGHVGIVAEDGASVIHADTGENALRGEPGEVRKVPLSVYIADATALGHYAVFLTGFQRDAYISYAEAAVGLPFDRGFSLKSENSLYCSELIWRALSTGAGRDILPRKSERFGRVYVSVSDLSEHKLVEELALVSMPLILTNEGETAQAAPPAAR